VESANTETWLLFFGSCTGVIQNAVSYVHRIMTYLVILLLWLRFMDPIIRIAVHEVDKLVARGQTRK